MANSSFVRALADRLDMPALLTDLVAFYRSFVVSIYYLWTQGNVRLPSGLTIVQLIRVCILAMGMPRFQAACA